MKHFYNNEHADNRLQRCFVGYLQNDKYVFSRVTKAGTIKVHLEDGSSHKLQDPSIIITPKHLGYVNTNTQCAYISRTTTRMWKAGVCNDNLRMAYVFPRYTMHDNVDYQTALANITNGTYISFRKAYLMVNTGRRAAVAFCPTMCVGVHQDTLCPVLYYKNKPFAYIHKDKIIIGDVNQHLVTVLRKHTDMEILI